MAHQYHSPKILSLKGSVETVAETRWEPTGLLSSWFLGTVISGVYHVIGSPASQTSNPAGSSGPCYQRPSQQDNRTYLSTLGRAASTIQAISI
jgi:hypothetical protein